MEVWKFLGEQPFVTLFLTLGLGHLLGRVKAGIFSIGPTAGSLLVALGLGALAFNLGGVRIAIPDLLQTTFLALFTYAVGLRVGPQFVTGLRSQGVQLAVVVLVTTTAAFVIALAGSRWLALPPGYAPGILAGANTISAVMGVASAAVSTGAYAVPAGFTAEQVQANIAAGYSLTYVFSILGIVMLVRNLPAMFGIDPVAAGRESERKFGHEGHALPGTAGAFVVGMLPVDVRVLQVASNTLIGRPASEVFERFDTPVLKLTRAGAVLDLDGDPALLGGDLLTVGGPIASLMALSAVIGPEVDDVAARHLDVDQADVVVTAREWIGRSLAELRHNLPGFGVRVRALFRGGHELPLLPGATLHVHDVVRVIGPSSGVSRFIAALGSAVQPTEFTRIAPLALGMAIGYAIGLFTVRIAGVPVGLGTMGGVVVMGILVSWVRTIFPGFGGPVPEGARQFLESIGVDLFVTGLGLTVAPSIVESLSQGAVTFSAIGLGLVTAVVPTFLSWVVGLYVLRMDPIVLAGAVSGARNSTTAMKAISDEAHSEMPAFGYPVPYALSTIVFLIYGYLTMMLS